MNKVTWTKLTINKLKMELIKFPLNMLIDKSHLHICKTNKLWDLACCALF